jgi:hypothetical protein
MRISDREKAIWRAAITLGNNICVQECDRINDDDGPIEAINATRECAHRIREWAEPTEGQLAEMFAEAGVPEYVRGKLTSEC